MVLVVVRGLESAKSQVAARRRAVVERSSPGDCTFRRVLGFAFASDLDHRPPISGRGS